MKRRIFCPTCRSVMAAYEMARRNKRPLPSRKLCARCYGIVYRRYAKPLRSRPEVRKRMQEYQAAYYRRRKGKAA